MSLKKAFCRTCPQNKAGHYSIFDAIPNADVCYCPFCTKKLVPNRAIKDFDMLISQMIDEAYKTLFEKTYFLDAYRMFANIIDICPDSKEARQGRLIALLYLATLRKNKMKEFLILFNEENERYFFPRQNSTTKTVDEYVAFLSNVNAALDNYDSLFRKRLTVHKYFYDVDCAKLYFVRLNEILMVKKELAEQLNKITQREKDHYYPQVDRLYTRLKKEIGKKEHELAEKTTLGDGYSYKLVEMSGKGNPLLARSDRQVKVPSIYNFNRSLYTAENKKMINDRVYPDNIYLYHSANVSYIVAWIFVVLTVIFLIMAIIQNSYEYHLAWLSFVLMGVCGVSFITLFSLKIYWRAKINSRCHLIN